MATSDEEAALYELEWALARWHESYARFARESLAAVGGTSLSAQEVMILQVIRLHDRPKTTAMIANLLNRTDTQNLQYSVRKLISERFIEKVKEKGAAGKALVLAATPLGRRLCDDLVEFRRTALIESLKTVSDFPERARSVARTTSLLTALYDQAEREAVRPAPAL